MKLAHLWPIALIPIVLGADTCSAPTFEWAPPGTDLAAPGPSGETTTALSLAAPSGCTLAYTRHAPTQPAGGAPLIVLSHGFQRSQAQMQDLATHLASWGFTVVTPDLCHSTPLDNDIPGDAADMQALAAAEGGVRVIYMGHSAGGMRSIVAGAEDPATVAVVGLDAVDALDYALEAAPSLAAPLMGIVGESSSCNAANNGIPVYEAAPDALAMRVTEADHCDFESPTDALCTSFCQGSNASFDDATIAQAIWGLATAAALWRGGVSEEGAAWWQASGADYQYLLDAGLVSPLVGLRTR